MEICLQEPYPREKLPSLLEIKNKIRAGHSECCSCCCCKSLQFPAYKYIQPEVPKPFRPVRVYEESKEPLEDKTTYKLSFWNGPPVVTKPILPKGCLGIADGEFTTDTTHKLSYVGNWCVKPQEKILPCKRDLFGRGPLQDKTTQKVDFPWKCGTKQAPIKYKGNLCLPKACLEDDTTYKLSYYESACRDPVQSFKPQREYKESCEPLEDYTTYNLSYFENEPLEKENYPWKDKPKYVEPTTPVDGNTTYKLSYWPQCAEPVKPIKHQPDENLLNKGPCFDDCTTYCLSYFGGDADRPKPVVHENNKLFDDCPLSHDTVNKMSYLGNWNPKPEKPILPCQRQLLGRGPLEDRTTQNCEFTWKFNVPEPGFKPKTNLTFSTAPLECCTTNRLSYLPNCGECLIPNKSYAPVREHVPSNEPFPCHTVMKLSYKPKEIPKVEKPWASKAQYQKPITKLDDDTTYGLSYIPPGTLVPCCPETPTCPPPETCPKSTCTKKPVGDTIPCTSC